MKWNQDRIEGVEVHFASAKRWFFMIIASQTGDGWKVSYKDEESPHKPAVFFKDKSEFHPSDYHTNASHFFAFSTLSEAKKAAEEKLKELNS